MGVVYLGKYILFFWYIPKKKKIQIQGAGLAPLCQFAAAKFHLLSPVCKDYLNRIRKQDK